jgi:hypothetical protein
VCYLACHNGTDGTHPHGWAALIVEALVRLRRTARVMARLYAVARLYVNFFQPSFKLKEKRREGAKVIKRYHTPSTACERALAHPKVTAAVKQRLRDQHRTLDPVALLAENGRAYRIEHRARSHRSSG